MTIKYKYYICRCGKKIIPVTNPSNNDTTDTDSSASNQLPDSTSTNTNPQGVTNITTLESPSTEDDPHADTRTTLAIATPATPPPQAT